MSRRREQRVRRGESKATAPMARTKAEVAPRANKIRPWGATPDPLQGYLTCHEKMHPPRTLP